MTNAVSSRIFEVAAELFALLSTPTRLRILHELCKGERKIQWIRSKSPQGA